MGDEQHYLESVYFSRICSFNGGSGGLTNQMFSLVSTIIKGIMLNKKAIAVDVFGLDYSTSQTKNISSIIDLKKTNAYLKEKYNVVLLDKNTMKFKLHKAYFGIMTLDYSNNTRAFDITNEISAYISKKDNSLFIPQNINFTSIKGDPAPNIYKYFYLYYSLDDYNFFDTFEERLKSDITSKVPSRVCRFDFILSGPLNKYMCDISNDILKNIFFKENTLSLSLMDDDLFINYNKINVIHLRIEDDGIAHWSKMNKMTDENYRIILENKYIELIKKYIEKDELTVILSYSPDNSVINYMKTNNYKYFYRMKNISNKIREIDAINDLCLSTKCNNIFIGNFSIKNYRGSSFSYYILQKLEYPHVKKVLIDLDNIREPEELI